MSQQPIGFFDSGVGGTTVWREVHSLLPAENTIYLADSKNAPYGEKSSREILNLSIKNTEFLLDQNCKLIVVACNTATTNAISALRQRYPVPFIGIEPAIKPAAIKSKTGKIGVLATRGTLASELFANTSRYHADGIEIVECEGTGLVSLIEEGRISGKEVRKLIASCTAPLFGEDIDHLVLGCTHYPYLIPALKKILPGEVTIVDCGQAVARQVAKVLEKHGLLHISEVAGQCDFFTNTGTEVLSRLLENDVISGRVNYLDF